MELKRVVVTGLGALTPVGNTIEETWKNLVAGVSGAAPIQGFDASKFKTQFACEVKNFNATDFIDKKEVRKMDRYEQLALVAAMEAVQDSGMDLESVDKNRIGVVLGVGIGGIHTFEEQIADYAVNGAERGPRFNPFFIPKMIADIAAGEISIKYGFHGPNYTTTSACASSTNAIAAAFDLIRLGKANVMVTGGAEAANAFETPVVNGDLLTKSIEYQEAGNWVGILYAVQAIGSVVWAMIIPRIKDTKLGYSLSLVLGGLGFVSIYFIHSPYILFLSFLLIGCAWAATLAYPFTLLTNALTGKGHMGTYLGLFNCTICLPQIVAAVLGGVVLSMLPAASNGAADQPMMLVLAGIMLFCGAFAVRLVKANG